MGTTKSRKSRRNNSRPTAFSFLSNIALGNEDEKPPDESIRNLSNYISEPKVLHFIQESNTQRASSLHSSDSSSSSADEENIQTTLPLDSNNRPHPTTSSSIITENELDLKKGKYLQVSNEDVEHHKLTRENSERPIASEKIKKKSSHVDKDHGYSSLSFMSVFRYYTDKIRQSTKKSTPESSKNRGYVQQKLENNDRPKHRKALSYADFLTSTGSLSDDKELPSESSYDPFFLDNDTYDKYNLNPSLVGTSTKLSDLKREMNEQFRLNHPEIPNEITLSKLRAIKQHLIEIGKQVDLEISSVAHAFVYFEKLILKNMITKKNRKLLAACCLFLATKVNEAKGTWFRPLLDAIHDELGIDAKEIHEHEFAVFADLEFDLYVPSREFMPHFERILIQLENKTIQEYLGNSDFYKINQRT